MKNNTWFIIASICFLVSGVLNITSESTVIGAVQIILGVVFIFITLRSKKKQ